MSEIKLIPKDCEYLKQVLLDLQITDLEIN